MNKEKCDIVNSLGEEIYKFSAGRSFLAGELFGVFKDEGANGYRYLFRTYAKGAVKVELTGEFNLWSVEEMYRINDSDAWECSVNSEVPLDGTCYKYRVYGENSLCTVADAFATYSLGAPRNESIIYTSDEFLWNDSEWISSGRKNDEANAPLNIYKVELSSFKRQTGACMNYRDIAETVAEYALEMGYTHILLSGFSERVTSALGEESEALFSPSACYGRPEDFKFFIDRLHLSGIGVLAVLYPFGRGKHSDASPVYESTFLSSSVFWYDEYHIDGFLLAAFKNRGGYTLASDTFHSWQRSEARSRLSEKLKSRLPKALLISESDTLENEVSRGSFDMYLNKTWGGDFWGLEEESRETKRYKYGRINYELMRSFESRYVLCFSLSEIMRGFDTEAIGEKELSWIKLILSYMIFHPGKKMITDECSGLENENIRRVWETVGGRLKNHICTLNRFYRSESALWEYDFSWKGFEWISHVSEESGVMAFARKGRSGAGIIAVINFEREERRELVLTLRDECGALELVFDGENYCSNVSDKTVLAESTEDGERIARLLLPPMSARIYRQAPVILFE